ncbi:L,D-transpeptidase family protein [Flavobacterium suzhouense]|uniref:Murein L,D-transpeptidase family protein n=1 Tax=Flavobacterium suzhouense TaxID=1529638 RepID=A0ABW5NQ56_9FLAO
MFCLLLFILIIIIVWCWYPATPLPKGTIIDKLVVRKSERKMEAYSEGNLIKTYNVALGKDPVGHKQFEGDNKTPEGIYIINDRNPRSAYYKNLGVSYPNATDKSNALKLGKPAGGDIKIHGLRNDKGYMGKLHKMKDWTAGCIAVTNDEMDELYATVKQNAEIEILK